MRSTRRIDALAPLLAALLLVGCPEAPSGPRFVGAGDDTPRSGGIFRFHHSSNVRGLDPHISFDELSNMGIRLLFDGLLDYDHEGNIIPSIAVSLPEISSDGKRFRFTLRDDVRFHNGRTLRAADVDWSMHRMLSEDVGSPGYPFFKAIVGAEAYHRGQAERVSGIQVQGDYAIEFQLEEADQTFLNAMAMTFAYPLPREEYEGREMSSVAQHPVGTGPFVFDSWERGVQLEFVRNERYWRPGRANPDRMIFYEGVKPDVAVKRFRNGDLDAIHSFTPPDWLFFRNEAPLWAPYREQFAGVTVTGLCMNTEMPPFDNVHVRRAIAHAIDRAGWARAKQGRMIPAGQALPPQIAGYDSALPSLQTFDLDIARAEMRLAREELEATGGAAILEEPITVLVGESRGTTGELLQADLARIGLRVELRPVSFAVYLQETGKPGRVQAFFSGWNMDFPDPSNFLDILFNSRSIHPENSENRSFFRNAELDALLNEARSERDPERRIALYRQANEIIAREAPWAFISYPNQMEVWQPYVRGYRPHPIWSEDYRDVWLDLPRRRAPREEGGAR